MEEDGPWELPRHVRKKENGHNRHSDDEVMDERKGNGNVTKFFITNLPPGCRPWDVADFFKVFGEVTGAYIARKPEKAGRKFGFISFKYVLDVKGMERALNGTKMGGYKIIAKLARFAKENVGLPLGASEGGGKVQPKQVHQIPIHNQSSFVKGKGKLSSELFHNDVNVPDPKCNPNVETSKTIEITDETLAFKDLIGCALVGRCKDLMTLRKLNEKFAEKRILGISLSYMGGLYMLVKFEDDVSCINFMMDQDCWKEWFSILDPWNNQSLPFERLAWVKVLGVPMHLADNDVLINIAEHFGKIVHGSQMEAGDGNMLVSWIGLLVGEGDRIHDHVTLRWKNKQFRVWIEEEINDWVPDSIGQVVIPVDGSSSSGSSKRDNMQNNDYTGDSDGNLFGSQVNRRSENMSVGEVSEKALEVNAVDVSVFQKNINEFNLEDIENDEEIGNLERNNDRMDVGNPEEVGKTQVLSDGAQGGNAGGAPNVEKEPQCGKGGSQVNVVPFLPRIIGPYFFNSLDHNLRPKCKSRKIRPRNKSSSQPGRSSPNSLDRPKKRLRDGGDFKFDLNVRGTISVPVTILRIQVMCKSMLR
ncbi:putative RNA recognition motif domain, nucleotide-binding alpha-beta plait domain superfamily [Helianthus annuus]|nr:putative RNA recognition motif domain, nucleotide-binding alpha-beta plait domain superfamily [Helianthus annuus]